jgi:hypothetical protein
MRFFENTLRPYLVSGYRVAVIVLPEAVSRQGIIHRYHEQQQQTGGGRLTIASAAASYRGILATEAFSTGQTSSTASASHTWWQYSPRIQRRRPLLQQAHPRRLLEIPARATRSHPDRTR